MQADFKIVSLLENFSSAFDVRLVYLTNSACNILLATSQESVSLVLHFHRANECREFIHYLNVLLFMSWPTRLNGILNFIRKLNGHIIPYLPGSFVTCLV